ncbi:MAG: hypothetical protein K0R24_426 [Gammaproteobacteria bacterium]|jgi:hypothetical protein|nr:hypothetical protein [Gammaproteobacteria bacterium]
MPMAMLDNINKFLIICIIAAITAEAYAAASLVTNTPDTDAANLSSVTELTDDAHNTDNADKTKADSIFNHEGFSITEYQDSVLGFVGEATVSSYLLDNQHAVAVELNGGPRIFRLNATYGFNLNNNQRIKITGERLDEKLDFDFMTDTLSRWVGQNALGADYAYMLDNKILQSLGFGGYYTHSASKELSNQTIHDSVNDLYYAEQRRIAGANSSNFHVDLNAHLWPYSRLKGGIDYDTVHFDTQHTNSQDVQGLGTHVTIEQRLLPMVKLTLGSQLRQTEQGYNVALSWLTPSIKGMQTELAAVTDFTKDLTSNQHYYTTGLRFNVVFDDTAGSSPQAVYSDLTDGSQESLIDWTRTPSVHMSTVLAVVGGSTLPAFMSCPAPGTVNQESNRGGLNYFTAPNGWHGTADEFYGSENIKFNTATYLNNSRTAQCLYNIHGNINTLLLQNDDAGQQVGNGWILQGTTYSCLNDATQCHFKDKRVTS